MSESRQQLHAVVHGSVHGVNFRYATMSQAHQLHLTGWVRNVYDGTVEVLAEGPREPLELLLQWLHSGPPSAHVTAVDARWSPNTEGYEHFVISENL